LIYPKPNPPRWLTPLSRDHQKDPGERRGCPDQWVWEILRQRKKETERKEFSYREDLMLGERKVVRFKCSGRLRDKVNGEGQILNESVLNQ